MLRRTLVLLCFAGCGGLAAPARLERNGCSYRFVAATGMYKLESGDGPTWFDPEGSQENFLEARGWGVSTVHKSNCRSASPPLPNHGLHAIDATSAQRGGTVVAAER